MCTICSFLCSLCRSRSLAFCKIPRTRCTLDHHPPQIRRPPRPTENHPRTQLSRGRRKNNDIIHRDGAFPLTSPRARVRALRKSPHPPPPSPLFRNGRAATRSRQAQDRADLEPGSRLVRVRSKPLPPRDGGPAHDGRLPRRRHRARVARADERDLAPRRGRGHDVRRGGRVHIGRLWVRRGLERGGR